MRQVVNFVCFVLSIRPLESELWHASRPSCFLRSRPCVFWRQVVTFVCFVPYIRLHARMWTITLFKLSLLFSSFSPVCGLDRAIYYRRGTDVPFLFFFCCGLKKWNFLFFFFFFPSSVLSLPFLFLSYYFFFSLLKKKKNRALTTPTAAMSCLYVLNSATTRVLPYGYMCEPLLSRRTTIWWYASSRDTVATCTRLIIHLRGLLLLLEYISCYW